MKTYRIKGQAFLSLVLLVGGIIAAATLTLAVVILSSLTTSYGVRASQTAEAVATAGVEDALLRLDRDNNFSYTSPGYSMQVGSSTATVTITQGPISGQATIVSEAVVSGETKVINVIVAENATTGQTSLVSWQESQ